MMRFRTISLLSLLIFGTSAFALDKEEILTVESLVKRHKLDEGLSPEQLFQGYGVLARELESYGHHTKAGEYYQKALKSNPNDKRSLELATSYLFNLFRREPKKAKTYFDGPFLEIYKKSDSKLKKPIKEFWDNTFKKPGAKQIKKENHNGFYGQFFKDRDILKLMKEKKFFEAFSLVNPSGLENRDINSQLQYDTLSFLNGKKSGFYCQGMLSKYPKSASVPLEICRYIKNGKTKYGNLKELKKRTQKELPHLTYLVDSLLVGGRK